MKYEMFVLQMKMLKQYKESKEDIEREIDDIVYQYCGVKAIRYDKQRYSFNQELSLEMQERLYRALDEPQRQLDFTIIAINQLEPIVEENLNKLPSDIQKAIKLLVWEKMSYHDVGKIIGYSDHGLWKRIRKEVEKI